jgi:HD-GYP domain-containing protein (c-di-GMP phosphodiesterase class II)
MASKNKKEVVGVLTNFGQIIPVKRGVENDTKFPVVDMNFYPDADNYLSKQINIKNDEEKWNDYRKEERERIFVIKKVLGKEISKNEVIKNNILNIITKNNETKMNKIELLKNIFKDILSSKALTNEATDLELSDIANEIINDNVENLLLNNVVMEYTYNPNEIKHSDTESIWLNINDITNWFKKYENS